MYNIILWCSIETGRGLILRSTTPPQIAEHLCGLLSKCFNGKAGEVAEYVAKATKHSPPPLQVREVSVCCGGSYTVCLWW